jgi:serine/threonine protein kinase
MNLIGREINGCYKIMGKIGENIFCRVYKMEGIFSPVKAVFKILKKSNEEFDLEEIYRFKQKMKGIYNIKHQNINSVYEVDEIEGNTYVIMEYVDGITLKECLESGNKLTFDEVLTLIWNISKGLDAAHRNGAMHNNLNLNNILIPDKNNFSNAKITNFGFSDLIITHHKNDPDFIENILRFLPPESCVIQNKMLDERSDLFSLGVIFYYLLTGKFPFDSDNIEGYFKKIFNDNVYPPSAKSSFAFPGIIDKLILKLLNPEKKMRYQSALSLVDDLEKIMRNETDFILGEDDLNFDSNFETDLIDREKEMDILSEMYSDAEKNKGKVCMISGVIGIGKEKLADEFGKTVFLKNGIFIKIKPDGSEIATPYNVFKKFFISYGNYLEKTVKESGELSDRKMNLLKDKYPSLARLFLSGTKSGTEKNNGVKKNSIKKEEFYGNIAEFFIESVDPDKTIVVYIKDAEFIDNDSMAVLRLLHEKIREKKILFIYSINSEGKHNAFINGIKTDKTAKKIDIDVLSKQNIRKIIGNIFINSRFEIPAKLIEFIYNNSGGIPFYAIEIVRQLINKEIIFPVIDKWEFDGEKLSRVNWKGKDDIIMNKIQLLKKSEIDILYHASALDADFSIDMLFKLFKLSDKTDIIASVEYLLSQEILKRENYGICYRYSINHLINKKLKGIMNSKLKNGILSSAAKIFENEFKQYKGAESLLLTASCHLKIKNVRKAYEYSYKSAELFRTNHGYYGSVLCYKTCLKLLKNHDLNLKNKKSAAERIGGLIGKI